MDRWVNEDNGKISESEHNKYMNPTLVCREKPHSAQDNSLCCLQLPSNAPSRLLSVASEGVAMGRVNRVAKRVGQGDKRLLALHSLTTIT